MLLVGRRDELAQIRQALTDRRELAAVLITGEAGIGKSMLLDAAIEAPGPNVVRVRVDALEHSIPYAALARLVASLADDPEHPVAHQADELAATLDVLGGGVRDQVEASFGRVCGGLTELIRAMLDRGPVTLAVDDLNVLDDDTLAALTLALRRLRNAPLALLGSSRAEAVAGPGRFGALVDALDAEGVLLRLPLSPFDEHAMAELVAVVLDGPADDDLVREMHRRTDGNPFFAVEITTSLRDEGRVDPTGRSGARLTSPMRLTRTDAVLRRFAPLDASGRAVLDVIAVLGRVAPSDLAVIADGAGIEAAEVAPVFDDLVARNVLAPVSDGGYVFTHDLVRDAVYDAIGPARQRLLHSAIAARLIAQRDQGKPADVLALARHVSASADAGDAEAVKAVAAAGDLVRDIAPGSAASHYARALALEPADDEMRSSLLARRCRALSLASLPAEAAAVGREALALLEAGPARSRTANVVIGALIELGAVDAAVAVADDAVASDPTSPVLAAQRASVLWNAQRFDESLAEAARADALPSASPAERLLTLGPLGLLAAYAGIPRALPEHTAEMLRLGANLPPTLELYSTAIASYALATSGFLALARAPLGRAEALMEDIGGTAFRAQVMVARVLADWFEGRWDEAMDAIERVAVETHDEQLAVQSAGLEAIEIEIRSWRGEAMDERLLTRDAPVPNFADLRAWATAGRLLTEGKLADARELLSEAGGRSAFEIAYRPMLLSRRIEVELADGETDTAERLLAELAGEPQRRANAWGEVAFLRSQALVTGDAVFGEQAADVAADEGLIFEQARCQLTAAELAPDAAAGLDSAYRTFQAVGADALRRRAGTLLKARGLKVPRQRATNEGPLSATEMKLARLIQQGMRNREIAAVLHLSPRTVEVYLSKIYAKLGVSSRLELARALDA